MDERKKILLVQLFSNGDCLYATAIARQIKTDFPDCHLTWAIAGFCKSIIANNPFVDEIMEVNSVKKNDEASFRKLKKGIDQRKSLGEFDEVFITHIMGTNQANYDGCIRSAIFRGYPYKVTVPVQPVLRLSDSERNNARDFSLTNNLSGYKHVVLFEFAPLSGQAKMTKELAIQIAENLTSNEEVAIILSSGNKIQHSNRNIIDGSVLTLRETAALTHNCTLLLGCSSGITWISTSDAARQLPMIQILNPNTSWVNPISRDFKRFGIDTSHVIEMTRVDKETIITCVKQAMVDFKVAKKIFNQEIPLHFKATHNIVYNLLCYLEFSAILKHIKINKELFGNRPSFYWQVFLGFFIAPFKLIYNFFTKKIFSNPK
ncbi:MAG: hypothetical protein ABJA90_04775 [Ginsengibacter sp.]